jgi:hypothetical protein
MALEVAPVKAPAAAVSRNVVSPGARTGEDANVCVPVEDKGLPVTLAPNAPETVNVAVADPQPETLIIL